MRTKTARVATKFAKQNSENLSLHVYDFDLTLFRSPEPPKWWDKKVHGHWWLLPESIGRPFLPDQPVGSKFWNNDIVKQARSSIQDPDVWAILCTGRLDKGDLRYRVAEILKGNNIDFDEVYLRKGNSVVLFKVAVLNHLLEKHGIKSVHLWEDNDDNIKAFDNVCKKLRIPFFAHKVQPNPTDISHIPEYEYSVLKKKWD